MPPTTTFLRLLAADDKPAALRAAIAAARAAAPTPDAYAVDPASFRQIPGSPFAYWVSEGVRRIFARNEAFSGSGRDSRVGMHTCDDFRFMRTWWEVSPATILSGNHAMAPDEFRARTSQGRGWVPITKGGERSPFYSDLAVVVNWERDGEQLKSWGEFRFRGSPWSRILQSTEYYFRPGITWPLRGIYFSAQAVPRGGTFSQAGKLAVATNEQELTALLALLNSGPFDYFIRMSAGKVGGVQYEAGLIGRVPVPAFTPSSEAELGYLAREAHDLKREADRDDEVTHPFTAPALVRLRDATSLRAACSALALEASARSERLADIQRTIDDRCFALYGFSAEDRAQIEGANGALAARSDGGDAGERAAERADDDEAQAEAAESIELMAGALASGARNAADLLMYAVGCAFGRWDVRIGREPALAPKLAEPFAPLPVCAPGALVGPDGLPASEQRIASAAWLRARPDAISLPPAPPAGSVAGAAGVAGVAGVETITAADYPLEVAWDGILVDDPDAPNDLVRRVRATLEALWGARADDIEAEACELLGVRDLRDELRNPRLFFDHHIKRYSKSRRKAPIYWLLQSPRRSYAIWLYYHRLDADLPFKALNFHLLPKIRLEEQRLEEQKAAKAAATPGSPDARRFAQAIDRQEALLADLREFRDALDRAARRYLTPDLNDGVLLNIAPYWEVVPWKEARSAWNQLLAGKYEWSAIGKQLREKGLIAARRT